MRKATYTVEVVDHKGGLHHFTYNDMVLTDADRERMRLMWEDRLSANKFKYQEVTVWRVQ